MARMRRRENAQATDFAREELSLLRGRLSSAYGVFNATSDPQLLEACILEISALHARYSSALKKLKESQNGDREK